MFFKPLLILFSLTGFSQASGSRTEYTIKQPAGIRNYGNFCFMASYLQSLFACPEFRQALLDYDLNSIPESSNQRKLMAGLQSSLRKWIIAPHENTSIDLKSDMDEVAKTIFKAAVDDSNEFAGDDAIQPALTILDNLPPSLRRFFVISSEADLTAIQVLPMTKGADLLAFALPEAGLADLGILNTSQELIQKAYQVRGLRGNPNVLTLTIARRRHEPVLINGKVSTYVDAMITPSQTIKLPSAQGGDEVTYHLMGITVFSGQFHYKGYARHCYQIRRSDELTKFDTLCNWYEVNDEKIEMLSGEEFELLQNEIASKFTILTYVNAKEQRPASLNKVLIATNQATESRNQVRAFLQGRIDEKSAFTAAMTAFPWYGNRQAAEKRRDQLAQQDSRNAEEDYEFNLALNYVLELIQLEQATPLKQKKRGFSLAFGDNIAVGDDEPRRKLKAPRTMSLPTSTPSSSAYSSPSNQSDEQLIKARMAEIEEIIMALGPQAETEEVEALIMEQSKLQNELDKINQVNAQLKEKENQWRSLVEERQSIMRRLNLLQKLLMEREEEGNMSEVFLLTNRLSEIETELDQL